MKVLILFAHPLLHRSEVNLPLYEASKGIDNVKVVDLYETYPDLQIDVEYEQKQLLEHDVIIFQFPMYWYSTPAILKQWQDLVLEHNFAYGKEGTALRGKLFQCLVSAGGSCAAYQTSGYNHFSIRELLRPLEQTANLTGMQYLAPFVLFSARSAFEEGRLEKHTENWTDYLTALTRENVNIERASIAEFINESIVEILDRPSTTESGEVKND